MDIQHDNIGLGSTKGEDQREELINNKYIHILYITLFSIIIILLIWLFIIVFSRDASIAILQEMSDLSIQTQITSDLISQTPINTNINLTDINDVNLENEPITIPT